MKDWYKIVSVKVYYCAQCPYIDKDYCVKNNRQVGLINLYKHIPKWCKIGVNGVD